MERRRRRRRGDIRRIRQRNRRVFLAVVLLCFIVGMGVLNLEKMKEREIAQQVYAEQQGSKKQSDTDTGEGEKQGAASQGEKGQGSLVLASDSEKSQWYLKLVNAENPMTQEDVPELEVETVDENQYQVDARIVADLQDMFDAARAAGRNPVICSAFRSWDYQVSLYENKIDRVMQEEGLNEAQAQEKAGTVVAKPGTSEHQMGLALDIVSSEYMNLDEGQMETEDQQWLIENSWKYGFILRYPLDKSDITGIIFEPWHYRYVGKKAAKEITEQGLTLEEYLGADPVGYPAAE
ncbi:MAG TPA: M15 family metallopeptidase [Candidatus Blautia pullicola]|uniref:M15 family metallopeptidase n=1 Tax=Candidatus Blautia pullicola TaxID=2838498 RepID=A0A9D2FP05_9FIRM|nr:M15 family metallopeptidase [Candidatus Blautia pullicola]